MQIVEVNLERVLELSYQYDLYAYDACMIECALRYQASLLSLD